MRRMRKQNAKSGRQECFATPGSWRDAACSLFAFCVFFFSPFASAQSFQLHGFLTVFSLNTVGERLRARWDAREANV